MYVRTCICVGAEGPPGALGFAGATGSDGSPGEDGVPGAVGESFIWSSYPFLNTS